MLEFLSGCVYWTGYTLFVASLAALIAISALKQSLAQSRERNHDGL